MTVRVVPVSSIHVDNAINVSRGGEPITDRDVAELADDIKSNGLLEEVGVIRIDRASWLSVEVSYDLLAKGFDYVLVYGFRRFKACTLIEFENIRVNDLTTDKPVTLADVELANVAENWGRKPANEYDLTIACDRFVTFHKLKTVQVAQRIQKPIGWVDDSVKIVRRVDPKLLQFYKANCSRDVRRKMLDLASVDGYSDLERFTNQQAKWAAMEQTEATERRTSPDGGIRPQGRRDKSGAIGRRDIIEFAELAVVAREWWNGTEWIPVTHDVRAALASMARWGLHPNERMPLR